METFLLKFVLFSYIPNELNVSRTLFFLSMVTVTPSDVRILKRWPVKGQRAIYMFFEQKTNYCVISTADVWAIKLCFSY